MPKEEQELQFIVLGDGISFYGRERIDHRTAAFNLSYLPL